MPSLVSAIHPTSSTKLDLELGVKIPQPYPLNNIAVPFILLLNSFSPNCIHTAVPTYMGLPHKLIKGLSLFGILLTALCRRDLSKRVSFRDRKDHPKSHNLLARMTQPPRNPLPSENPKANLLASTKQTEYNWYCPPHYYGAAVCRLCTTSPFFPFLFGNGLSNERHCSPNLIQLENPCPLSKLQLPPYLWQPVLRFQKTSTSTLNQNFLLFIFPS